jgi:hypothetical protein
MCLAVVAVAGGGQVHTIAGSMESDGVSVGSAAGLLMPFKRDI